MQEEKNQIRMLMSTTRKEENGDILSKKDNGEHSSASITTGTFLNKKDNRDISQQV